MAEKRRLTPFMKVSLRFDKVKSQLVIKCPEARGLKNTISYVKGYLQPDPSKKSKIKGKSNKKKTSNPQWGGEMTIPLTNLPAHMDRKLELTVWEKTTMSKDFLGRMSFKLSELLPPNDDGIQGWYKLLDADDGKHRCESGPDAVGIDKAKMYRAISSNEPRSAQELFMRKEDLIEKLDEEKEWTLARNVHTGHEGYVPTVFLAPSWSLESEDWYLDQFLGQRQRRCWVILCASMGASLSERVRASLERTPSP